MDLRKLLLLVAVACGVCVFSPGKAEASDFYYRSGYYSSSYYAPPLVRPGLSFNLNIGPRYPVVDYYPARYQVVEYYQPRYLYLPPPPPPPPLLRTYSYYEPYVIVTPPVRYYYPW